MELRHQLELTGVRYKNERASCSFAPFRRINTMCTGLRTYGVLQLHQHVHIIGKKIVFEDVES